MARRARVLGRIALLLVGVSVARPTVTGAQSAADKGTARQLATAGIQLFRQDRFADALDKLERAESLFDAPVHLLYIARCQAKLNRLVEAAEAYRRLIRTELSIQAPQTFKDAVADGQKELPEIEPKVPSLRVEVVPANAKDLRLTIDGESVSTAVLGVDRPINPGSHVIEVAAKGQASVSRRVDVAISSKQVVKLDLATGSDPSGANASAAGAAPVGAQATNAPADRAPRATAAPIANRDELDANRAGKAAENAPHRLKIVGGLDMVGSLPFAGKIDRQPGTGATDHRDITERYGPGAGLELRVGLAIPVGKFALTPLLFVNAHSHAPGPLYKSSADQSFGLDGDISSVMKTEPTSNSGGLALRFDTAPLPLQIGGFGEFGALVRQAYTTTGTWTVVNPSGKCDFVEEFVGVGVRMRGGVFMPVTRLVTLVGSAGFTFANVNTAGFTKRTCDNVQLSFPGADKATVPAGSRSVHAVFSLGVGAEFGLGL